ncbi:unnamed protein product [Arabis nemorensis]|uniref:Uncharacterized protein n=1 Tax=Arabis nemorensis TaxID=586526 RepID=A0A565AJR7_9BRAS|nr:unnamed protein product [Arabis nemorensis]
MKPEGKRSAVGRQTKEGDCFDMSTIKLAINETEKTKTRVHMSVAEKYMKRKVTLSADFVSLLRERRAKAEKYMDLVRSLRAKGMYVPFQ